MNDLPVEPIAAAGGVVVSYASADAEPAVLMIFRNGYWDLPKGKVEPGESIEMCAAREVSEEVGSGIPAIVRDLGTSYHEYIMEGKIMGKTTYWYSMIFTRKEHFTPQKEEGIEQVAWVPLSQAIDKAGFDNLREILENFMP
jgi:8-oxo-dGTP pyrophosphatase MutT (NUDIX family)